MSMYSVLFHRAILPFNSNTVVEHCNRRAFASDLSASGRAIISWEYPRISINSVRLCIPTGNENNPISAAIVKRRVTRLLK